MMAFSKAGEADTVDLGGYAHAHTEAGHSVTPRFPNWLLANLF